MPLVNNTIQKIKKGALALSLLAGLFLLFPNPAFAQENSAVTDFANQTLQTFIIIASITTALFLVKGGYEYMTSQGNPDGMDHAKGRSKTLLLDWLLLSQPLFLTHFLIMRLLHLHLVHPQPPLT